MQSWFHPRANEQTQKTSIRTASLWAKIQTGPLKYDAYMLII
jgi:hypothetical protein